MALDDAAHRFDRVLEPLAAADQAERRNDGTLAYAEGRLCRRRILERNVRHAVVDDFQRSRIDAVDIFEQPATGLRKRYDSRRLLAQLAGHAQIALVRFRQDGVHRQHDRLVKPTNETDEPLATFSAEETVLVLNVDEIDGIGVDELGGGCIARSILFGDAADHLGPVAADPGAGLADRDDRAREAKRAIVRVDHVLGKRGDSALARWIRAQ